MSEPVTPGTPVTPAAGPTAKPDYGLDAPGVVRNLVLAAVGGLVLFVGAAAGLWPASPRGVPLAATGLACFFGFGATALFMAWYSRVGKVDARERMLDQFPWRGDEVVLDVGCGKGLMLVAAARRLKADAVGRAVGIDIWQSEDLTGNSSDATLENARREGVADCVEVKTADMRHVPFPDCTFDAVVSVAAIHNLYERPDRQKAIAEIARVLKPGGFALINDIRHHAEYADSVRRFVSRQRHD
jgi:arsenite methyltransferase